MSASAPVQSQKICVTCGADLSNQKRVKDHEGRYFCHPCWERAAAAKPVDIGANDATGSAERIGLSSFEKRLLLTGLVFGLLLVVSLVYFLFLRDRWENQNTDALITYKTTAETAARAGKLDEAKSSYAQFLKLLGDHKVRDPSLQTAISAVENDARHVDELIASKEQTKREADAAAAKAKHDADAQAKAKADAEKRALEEASAWKPIQPTPNDALDVSYEKFADKSTVGTKNTDPSWKMTFRVGGIQPEQPFTQPFSQPGWGVYGWVYTVFKGHAISDKPAVFGLCLTYRTGDDSLGIFHLSSAGDDAFLLVDGGSVPLKLETADDKSVLVLLAPEVVVGMANAKSVEAKVGSYEFKFTPLQLASVKKMLQGIGMMQ